ncbi:MAG: rubrerythrin [Kiritimatiellia bacterium]
MTLKERAEQVLAAAGSRGQIKVLGRALDADDALRQELLELARQRGVQLPDDAMNWPGKRLLRRARNREEQARERSNPIARDEAFVCGHCGEHVEPHGRTARDHCAKCLRSLHVDVVPGDRASSCGGLMDPVAAEQRGADWSISYRCRRCGHLHRNRAVLDGDLPDDWDVLSRVAARMGA